MMTQAGPPSQWAEQELWFLGKEPEELHWKLQDSGGSQGSQERLWLQLPQLSATSPKLGVALAWLVFRRSSYSVYPWERQILCTSEMKRKENRILLSPEGQLFLLPALILQEWENLVTKGTLQGLSIKNTLKKYNPSRFLSSKNPSHCPLPGASIPEGEVRRANPTVHTALQVRPRLTLPAHTPPPSQRKNNARVHINPDWASPWFLAMFHLSLCERFLQILKGLAFLVFRYHVSFLCAWNTFARKGNSSLISML